MRWHQMSGEMVIDALRTRRRGLGEEAPRVAFPYGPDVLIKGKRRTPVGVFFA